MLNLGVIVHPQRVTSSPSPTEGTGNSQGEDLEDDVFYRNSEDEEKARTEHEIALINKNISQNAMIKELRYQKRVSQEAKELRERQREEVEKFRIARQRDIMRRKRNTREMQSDFSSSTSSSSSSSSSSERALQQTPMLRRRRRNRDSGDSSGEPSEESTMESDMENMSSVRLQSTTSENDNNDDGEETQQPEDNSYERRVRSRLNNGHPSDSDTGDEDQEDPHAPVQLPTSVDFMWGMEKESGVERAEEENRWKPCLSPFDEDIEKLRLPWEDTDMSCSECWGCSTEDSVSGNFLADAWNKLIELFIEGMQRLAKPYELANSLFFFFSNQVLQPLEVSRAKYLSGHTMTQEERLVLERPIWTRYGLLVHLIYHTSDPQILIEVAKWKMASLGNVLYRNCLFQIHEKSQRRRVDGEALKDWERIQKLLVTTLRVDPSKLPTANKNRSFVPRNNGLLAPGKRAVVTSSHSSLYKG